MSKAKAAASIVGGLLLALVGGVGLAALLVATLLDTYSGGIALWLGFPLMFVAGATLAVYGIAVLLREFSDLADGSLDGLSDLGGKGDLQELRRLYKRID